MAKILEMFEFLQKNRMTKMEIRGSRIEAFLLAAGYPAAARGGHAALMQP